MTAEAVADHLALAEDFLTRSWENFEKGDLHQASEKGWGAAAHLAKALAARHGWEYESHDQFGSIMDNARQFYRQPNLRHYRNSANYLHQNYYKHPSLLRADSIGAEIADVTERLAVMRPFIE